MVRPAREGKYLSGTDEKCTCVKAGAIFLLSQAICAAIFLGMAYADPITLQASWYNRASLIKEGTWKDGKETRMANGKAFDENALTCAVRLWPLGTVLLVSHGGKTVRVVVTDRIGKRFAKTRIDLSMAAFKKLADLKQGLINVRTDVLK